MSLNVPHKAFDLIAVMQRQALSADVITFSAAISACEKGSQPHKAFGLMAVMQRQALSPRAITFNAVISAREMGSLLNLLHKEGFEDD